LLRDFLPLVSWPAVGFANAPAEIWLEVGFGGGEHALALAASNPQVGIIAAEVFENGICSLLSRLAPVVPANLRLFTDDARPLLRGMADGALAKLFLMFPDPWPKARHAKRRFVHPDLVVEAARVLRAGGEWRVASDDPTYQAWADGVFAGQSSFIVSRYDERPAGWPGTRYEAKAKAAGRAAVYWSLIRG